MKSVSIVIPCRNEEHYIIRCLNSIMLQDYKDGAIDVFVCDGMSTDATTALVEKYALTHPMVHVLMNKKQTTPFALNLGIRKSEADVVIILGAHSELYPDYISKCMEAFSLGTNIGCTGGIIENEYENETAEVIGKAMSSSFGVGNAHFRTGNKNGYVDTVAFGAYKREVFSKVGYFDEELIRNQDDEFNYRVTKAGFKIYLYSEIRCKYFVRASFGKLFKQYYQYGYWKVYVAKKHHAVTTFRQLVPLFFVLFLIGTPVLLLFNSVFIHNSSFEFFVLCAYILGLLLYMLVSLISSLMLSLDSMKACEIGLSFFILHFSYGWGYLIGIIDFFIFQKQIKKEESLTR